jgi:hypothetical protein
MVMQRHGTDLGAILRAISVYEGVTSADGNALGTTLICANIPGTNDFITNKTILLQSGNSIFEDSSASLYNPVTKQITVSPAFSGPVLKGTQFYVLPQASAGAIVPLINAIIGKTNLIPADIANQLDVNIPAILAALGGEIAGGIAIPAAVTTYTDPTHFKATSLEGLGDNYFSAGWYVYVQWKSTGTGGAPQGEYKPVVAFTSLDGTVQHTAFSVPFLVTDKVLLIHPALAYMLGLTPTKAGYIDTAISSRAAPGNAMDLLAATIVAIRQTVCAGTDPAGSIGKLLNDYLNASSASILAKLVGTVTTNTYSLPYDNAEHDAITFPAAYQQIDIEIFMNNLATNNTVREYVNDLAVTPQQISAKIFPTNFDTGTKAVTISFIQKNAAYKISLQAVGDEGGAKNVPYRIMTRPLA